MDNVFNFVWANDQTVYYTVPNAQLRPYQVYAHIIGTEQSEDVLVYEELDDTVFVDITSSKDGVSIFTNNNKKKPLFFLLNSKIEICLHQC